MSYWWAHSGLNFIDVLLPFQEFIIWNTKRERKSNGDFVRKENRWSVRNIWDNIKEMEKVKFLFHFREVSKYDYLYTTQIYL